MTLSLHFEKGDGCLHEDLIINLKGLEKPKALDSYYFFFALEDNDRENYYEIFLDHLKKSKMIKSTENINKNSNNIFFDTIEKSHANGGVLAYKIELSLELELKQIRDSNEFIKNLFQTEEFKNATKELKHSSLVEDLSLVELNPLDGFGKICSVVYYGGAYSYQNNSEIKSILGLVCDFLDNFIPFEWTRCKTFVSYSKWAGWYYGVAWDYTFIFLDEKTESLFLICVTDTD